MKKTIILATMIFLSTVAHADTTTGLVGYWPFESSSNNTTNDLSGNNKTATVVNGPRLVAGKIGSGALQFDGVDDYMTVDTSLFPMNNASRSVAGWIKSNNRSQSATIFSYGSGSYTFYVSFGAGSGILSTAEGSAFVVFSSTNIADDQWHHFVIVHDETNLSQKIYVDGKLENTKTNEFHTQFDKGAQDLTAHVGNRAALNRYFSGSLDDLRMYSRALTASDVTELFNYRQGQIAEAAPAPAAPAAVNGTCGAAAKNYASGESFPQGAYCSSGTASPATPGALTAGSQTSWVCQGSNGGTNSGTCQATMDAAAVQAPSPVDDRPIQYQVNLLNAANSTVRTFSGNTAVQLCADAAVAGQTCLVNPGTYSQRINVRSSGTSGSPITFLAKGQATVCGFDFTNNSYVRIVGFTLDSDAGCTITSSNVSLSGTNNYLEFWNNTFTDASYNAIRLGVNDYIHNSIILGNKFSNYGVGNGSGMGVGIQGNNNLIAYNELSNMHPDGFMMFGSFNRWINNYTHDFSEASGGHSDLFQTGSRPAGWSYNLIEANFQVGMGNAGDEHVAQISNGQAATYCPNNTCGAMTENIFRRNIWHNISSGTVGINQSFDGAISYTRYYNNTTADASVHYPANGYGISWYGPGTNYDYLFNNIEYESWGKDSTSYVGVYCLSLDNGCIPTGVTYGMDYNLAYDPDGAISYIAPWSSQAHALSNVDPMFIDFANDDFHLQHLSPSIGAAGALTRTVGSGTGKTFTVADGGFFRGDNVNLSQYEGNLVVGDTITVGTDTVEIESVSGNTITATSSFTWGDNEPVYWADKAASDIGAYPYLVNGNDFNILLSTNNVGVKATVTNPQAVRFVVFYVDGLPFKVVNKKPYMVLWNDFGLAAGSQHTIEARAYYLYASKTLWKAAASTISMQSSSAMPVIRGAEGQVALLDAANSVVRTFSGARPLQDCADVGVAGQTCYVFAGNYDERVTVKSSGTSDSNRVTFISAPGKRAKVKGFTLSSRNYVTIKGFEITSLGFTPENDRRISITGGAGIKVVDNYIHDSSYAQCITSTSTFSVYSDNEFSNCGVAMSILGNAEGAKTIVAGVNDKIKFSVQGGASQTVTLPAGTYSNTNDYALLRDNVTPAMVGASLVFGASGRFEIRSSTLAPTSTIILEPVANNAYNTFGWRLGLGSMQGLQSGITISGSDSLFENNTISNVGDYVTTSGGAQRLVIRNNIFGPSDKLSAQHIDGIQSNSTLIEGTRKVLFEGNLSIENNNVDNHFALFQQAGDSNLILRYNLSSESNGSIDFTRGTYYGGGDASLPGAFFYNNTFYNNAKYMGIYSPQIYARTSLNNFSLNNVWYNASKSPTSPYSPANTSSVISKDYDLWFGGTGDPLETNDINADPQFTDPSKFDFTLASSLSPAVDKAAALTTATNAGANSTTLQVAMAGFFQDGWGGGALQGVLADEISVGSSQNHAKIASIDYGTNTITLSSVLTWQVGDPIRLYSNSSGKQVLYGLAGDIGANELVQATPVSVPRAVVGSGDVSGDGKVTMYDAALALRYMMTAGGLTDGQIASANMDGNKNNSGKDIIENSDVMAIAKKALGL